MYTHLCMYLSTEQLLCLPHQSGRNMREIKCRWKEIPRGVSCLHYYIIFFTCMYIHIFFFKSIIRWRNFCLFVHVFYFCFVCVCVSPPPCRILFALALVMAVVRLFYRPSIVGNDRDVGRVHAMKGYRNYR